MKKLATPAGLLIRPASGRAEFIALAAAFMALNALAIDIMLPAMQQIGMALGVEDENQRQLVLTAYIVGFGLAQLFVGPISDRFGRRGPLLVGLCVYTVAAILAALAPDFWMMLTLRAVQGAGGAATRVIAISIVRDTYGGRQMAEVMSLVMMVFMIAPVIAPGIGQILLLFANWPLIFFFMGICGLMVLSWSFCRMPESLATEHRRALTASVITQGFAIVLTNRLACCYAVSSALIFGGLFGFVSSAQQIFVGIYNTAEWFPLIFAGIAGMMAFAFILNSRLVVRLGMRRLSHGALIGSLGLNAVWLFWSLSVDTMPITPFLVIFAATLFLIGWMGPNFDTLAMERLGDVAGTASSVLGFIQTLGGGLIGACIGLAFDGTVAPLAFGFFLCSVGALVLILIAEKGRILSPQQRL